MSGFTIAVAQLDPIVGHFEANVRKIAQAYRSASEQGARVLLTPELSVCGYPPLDLIDRPELVARCERAVDELCALTRKSACALLVGHVTATPGNRGIASENRVTILEQGKRVFTQAKTLLPNYDVFDESRYFEPSSGIRLWSCDGKQVAIGICEDFWAADPARPRQLYDRNPVDEYRRLGAEAVLAIASSPYEWAKRERRERIHAEHARSLRVPLVYVNQVGATDEILFDGGSFAVDSGGSIRARLPVFESGLGLIDLFGGGGWTRAVAEASAEAAPSEIETLRRGLVLGIRDYFARTGFRNALIGLSGGVDSAVVAALAIEALGEKHVLGVGMPSQFSSSHSLEDAEALARNLGIGFEVRPIKFLFSTASREIAGARPALAPIALENLQSRLRGTILMTLANHHEALVLTTGNKSELATGYGTLYGDMVGALAPIGDLFKTRVYELGRHLNETMGHPIPERIFTKAPSAELRPNQTDQDTLPPYDALDELLAEYLEKRTPLHEIHVRLAQAHASVTAADPQWIDKALRRVELNEYKRRQIAPVLKVSSKAFGIGRRVPIAKHWSVEL